MYTTSASPQGKVELRLGQIMDANRMSVREVSDLTGISRQAIYNLKDGKTAGVRFDVLAALVEGLGISITELLRYDV